MVINTEISRLITQIREDKTQGASELARQVLEVLKIAASGSQAHDPEQFYCEIQVIGQCLMNARPAMAPIYNVVNILLKETCDNVRHDMDYARRSITLKADELIHDSLQALSQIATHTAELISENDVVVTHSYSSTVEIALKSIAGKKKFRVIATRSGVGWSGERTVRGLVSAGILPVFIDDTAIGIFIKRSSKVLVGADRICADGGMVNGVGTCLLALAAKKAGVPFYVLCETLKFDARMLSTQVELEEKDPSEILLSAELREKVEIKNPYFDITPLELITGLVTEAGLIDQSKIISSVTSASPN